MITLTIKNIFLEIQSDNKTEFVDLKNYLKVKEENYHFIKNKSRWDGYYRFINGNKCATGFIYLIIPYLHKKGIKYSIIDSRTKKLKIDKIDYTLGDITLRDYQQDVLNKIIYNINSDYGRGIINAATNAGKDYIIASLYKNINVPTLLIVHNKDIYTKAVRLFSNWFDVGEICSGKTSIKQFTICMNKTLLNKLSKELEVKEYINTIKCVIVDEGHRAAAKEYQKLLSSIDCAHKFLFSGTPLAMENKLKKMKLVGTFGKPICNIKNDFLIENNYSQKPTIIIKHISQKFKHKNYTSQYEDLCNNKDRLNFIAKVCKKYKDEQILISFNIIEHGKTILDHLLINGIKDCNIVSGEDSLRQRKIDLFNEGKIRVLISSMILKEGVNIPNIRTLIMAQGGKSEITVKQYIGRALRHDGKNNTVKVFDFYDNIGDSVEKHSLERIAIYKKEKFDIKFLYDCDENGYPN